jgi:hypothetical protein
MQLQYSQLAELVKADHIQIAALCARFDSLAAAVQSAEPPKTAWKCPVCCHVLSHMRSFKAQVKRLYEFYHPDPNTAGVAGVAVPHAQHRCQLISTTRRHTNLVSLFGPPGSHFPARTKAFAYVLW